jgi:hypothetical protein
VADHRVHATIARELLAGVVALAGWTLIGYAFASARDPVPAYAGTAPSSSLGSTTLPPPSTTSAAPVTTTSLQPAPSAVPTTAAPTTTTIPALDVTALAATCESIPQGTVDPKLTIAQLGSGHSPDSRSGVPTDWVGVGYATEMTDSFRTLAPFSVTVAVDDPAVAPPAPAGGPLIDTLGQLQLWAVWDGANLHKVVRHWDGTAWSTLVDEAAEPLTLEMATTGVFLFWPDLAPGTKMAGIVAQSGACAQVGLANRPTVDVTGVE